MFSTHLVHFKISFQEKKIGYYDEEIKENIDEFWDSLDSSEKNYPKFSELSFEYNYIDMFRRPTFMSKIKILRVKISRYRASQFFHPIADHKNIFPSLEQIYIL